MNDFFLKKIISSCHLHLILSRAANREVLIIFICEES